MARDVIPCCLAFTLRRPLIFLCCSMLSLSPFLLSSALYLASNVCASHGTVRAALASQYSKTHSLGTSYEFNPRDGWQTVNVTNTLHQARHPHKPSLYDTDHVNIPDLERRRTKKATIPRKHSSNQPLGAVGKTIKFIGNVINVVITW